MKIIVILALIAAGFALLALVWPYMSKLDEMDDFEPEDRAW